MGHLKEQAETRLASLTAVSLNVTTKTTLLNIAAGENFIPTRVVMSNFSASAAAGVANFGCNANADDWMTDVLLTNANAAATALDVHKIGLKTGAMTPERTAVYAGATTFGLKMDAAIAVTCDIDVFGYTK